MTPGHKSALCNHTPIQARNVIEVIEHVLDGRWLVVANEHAHTGDAHDAAGMGARRRSMRDHSAGISSIRVGSVA